MISQSNKCAIKYLALVRECTVNNTAEPFGIRGTIGFYEPCQIEKLFCPARRPHRQRRPLFRYGVYCQESIE